MDRATEITTSPNSEQLSNTPILTTVRVAENASLTVRDEARVIRTLVDTLNVFKLIAYNHIKNPLQDYSDKDVLLNKMEGLAAVYSGIRIMMNQLHDLNGLSAEDPQTEELTEDMNSRIEEELGRNREYWPRDGGINEITLGSIEDILGIRSEISLFYHDFGNIIGCLVIRNDPKHLQNFIKNKADIDESFVRMFQFLEYQDGKLTGEFPKKPVSVQQMHEIINTHLGEGLTSYTVSIASPTEEMKEKKVEFHPEELIQIVENIVQNLYRYNNDPSKRHPQESNGAVTVIVNLVAKGDSNKPSHVEIVFRDNGEGFKKEGEFVMGESGGKGKGIGMASHAVIVSKHYKGRLHRRNFRDSETNDIHGGEVVLELPLMLE